MMSGILGPEEENVLESIIEVLRLAKVIFFVAVAEVSDRAKRSAFAGVVIALNPLNFMVIFCCL